MLPPGIAEGIASGKIDLSKIDPAMIAQFAAMAKIDPAVIAQFTSPAESKPGLSFSKPAVTPGEPLRLEIESFLDSVRTRREPRVTARQGRDALALALEIQASMAAHAHRAGLDDFFTARRVERALKLPLRNPQHPVQKAHNVLPDQVIAGQCGQEDDGAISAYGTSQAWNQVTPRSAQLQARPGNWQQRAPVAHHEQRQDCPMQADGQMGCACASHSQSMFHSPKSIGTTAMGKIMCLLDGNRHFEHDPRNDKHRSAAAAAQAWAQRFQPGKREDKDEYSLRPPCLRIAFASAGSQVVKKHRDRRRKADDKRNQAGQQRPIEPGARLGDWLRHPAASTLRATDRVPAPVRLPPAAAPVAADFFMRSSSCSFMA